MSEAEDKVKEKDKERIMPNDIVWHEALLNELYWGWLKKYSSGDISINQFYEFLKGENFECDIGFEEVISDADLVRIGFLLGLSYDRQNIVFKKYRTSQGRKNRLNNNLCPKNKDSFLGSDKRVRELSGILKRNGYGFVVTNLLSNKISKLESYRGEVKAKIIECQAILKQYEKAYEIYNQRIESCENEKRR